MRRSEGDREERIASLVAEYVERLKRGDVPDAEEVCRKNADLADDLRGLLAMAARVHDATPRFTMAPGRAEALERGLVAAAQAAAAQAAVARAAAARSDSGAAGPFRDPFEILLALLYVKGKWSRPGDPVDGALRMMKAVFLLSLETRLRRYRGYRFRAYKFGPFADEVYTDLERLKKGGLVDISGPWREKDAARRKASAVRFKLTPEGLEAAKGIVERVRRADPDLVDEIRRVKSKLSWATRDEFLRYVYARYPEMTTKSEIAKEISGLEEFARRHAEEPLWEG